MVFNKIFFQVEFLKDKILIKRICVGFHEYILLFLILKRLYFKARKAGILRWSLTEQQVSYLCIFPGNVTLKYRRLYFLR